MDDNVSPCSIFCEHPRRGTPINLDRALAETYRHRDLGSYSLWYFNSCLEIRILLLVVDFDGTLWTWFRSSHPLESAKVRPNGDLGKARGHRLNTENLFHQPSRGSARPPVTQTYKGTLAVIGLEMRMEWLLWPARVITFPKGRRVLPEHSAPEVAEPGARTPVGP